MNFSLVLMKVFKTKKDAAIASFFMTPVEPFCDPAGITFIGCQTHILLAFIKMGNRNGNHKIKLVLCCFKELLCFYKYKDYFKYAKVVTHFYIKWVTTFNFLKIS